MRYKFYKSQSKTTHEFTPQNNVISTASLLQIKVLSHTGGGGCNNSYHKISKIRTKIKCIKIRECLDLEHRKTFF